MVGFLAKMRPATLSWPKKSWKNPARGRFLAISEKIWRSALDKGGKLVIIEVDDLASSLFRPRRFASLRAAGFLFFLADFCYNHAFPRSLSQNGIYSAALFFSGKRNKFRSTKVSLPFFALAMNPKCWLLEGHVARLNLPGVSLAFDAERPADGLAKIAVLDRPWSERPPVGRQRFDPVRRHDAHGLARPRRRFDRGLRNGPTRCGPARSALACGPTCRRRPVACSHRSAGVRAYRSARLATRCPPRKHSSRCERRSEKCDSLENIFAARGWSLALMVHPADLGHQELTAEAAPSATRHLRQQLFRTESLEKGVILRAGRGLGSCPPASMGLRWPPVLPSSPRPIRR